MAFYEVLIFIIAAVGTILLPVGYRIFDQYKPIPGVLIMAYGFFCSIVTIAGVINLLT
jgi:hypothetical protein